ncbi:peptidase A2 [Mucilaginibacter rubeus]|nr:peptidase A2 [Mucilaginibacter rubeus]
MNSPIQSELLPIKQKQNCAAVNFINYKMKRLIIYLLVMLPARGSAQATMTDLSLAAARALPAVVRVTSYLSDSLLSRRPQLPAQIGQRFDRSAYDTAVSDASGVLLSTNGYIITNAHVIAAGDSVVVILQDRRAFHATVLGIDAAADLALLKIQADGLPFLEIGNSNLVRIGDPVLAVGNPLELNSTVTAGILSARFRGIDDLGAASGVNSYLQTDAASNEGMSGSALVDVSGKLIGINAAILSPTGSFSGYSFAIPSGIVKKAWLDLVAFGEVHHASLDIVLRDMDARQAGRLKTKNVNGVLVKGVIKGGAGDLAGVRKDDILLMLDKITLENTAQCREMLAERAPGDRITLVIWRDNGQISLPVKLSADNNSRNVAGSKGDAWPLLRTVHRK